MEYVIETVWGVEVIYPRLDLLGWEANTDGSIRVETYAEGVFTYGKDDVVRWYLRESTPDPQPQEPSS